MELSDFKDAVLDYTRKGHPDKIKLLGWFLHTQANKTHFKPADVKSLYDRLHDTPPGSFSGYFDNLVKQKCLLRNASGYRLTGELRDTFSNLYAQPGHKVHVTNLLKDLPAKIPNLAERTYLDEALICYANGAFRAAVVMTWNLTYHHLCDHVVRLRLNDFNQRWLIKMPGQHKNGTKQIGVVDDFMAELKENEMIAICKDAGIITKDVWKILDEKLGRRNSAAHASSVIIDQLQTDAFIDDLIRNVVLKIA